MTNYYKGKLCTVKDPLFGPTGSKGSVWSRLGDMLIDKGLYKMGKSINIKDDKLIFLLKAYTPASFVLE